jgi:hypothetical protein
MADHMSAASQVHAQISSNGTSIRLTDIVWLQMAIINAITGQEEFAPLQEGQHWHSMTTEDGTAIHGIVTAWCSQHEGAFPADSMLQVNLTRQSCILHVGIEIPAIRMFEARLEALAWMDSVVEQIETHQISTALPQENHWEHIHAILEIQGRWTMRCRLKVRCIPRVAATA